MSPSSQHRSLLTEALKNCKPIRGILLSTQTPQHPARKVHREPPLQQQQQQPCSRRVNFAPLPKRSEAPRNHTTSAPIPIPGATKWWYVYNFKDPKHDVPDDWVHEPARAHHYTDRVGHYFRSSTNGWTPWQAAHLFEKQKEIGRNTMMGQRPEEWPTKQKEEVQRKDVGLTKDVEGEEDEDDDEDKGMNFMAHWRQHLAKRYAEKYLAAEGTSERASSEEACVSDPGTPSPQLSILSTPSRQLSTLSTPTRFHCSKTPVSDTELSDRDEPTPRKVSILENISHLIDAEGLDSNTSSGTTTATIDSNTSKSTAVSSFSEKAGRSISTEKMLEDVLDRLFPSISSQGQ